MRDMRNMRAIQAMLLCCALLHQRFDAALLQQRLRLPIEDGVSRDAGAFADQLRDWCVPVSASRQRCVT
jgi:hypothetical protein